MIPQCYPSVVNPVTKASEMQVYILSSVSGLVRWTDYIPIKFTDANPKKENTTDVGGYIPIKALSSTTGYTQWVDYVPVYVDSSATDAWQCSNVGFIPYSYGATLDLNFLTYTSLPSTVTFTRGSSGTFFGSDGLLKVQGYNLLLQSVLPAGTDGTIGSGAVAPTSWSFGGGSGVVATTASSLWAGENAYTQTATAQRPYITQAVTLQANTAYTASVYIEAVSGSLTAQQCLWYSTGLAGFSIVFPVCPANPSGGATGIVTTGRLYYTYTTAGTGGAESIRYGAGGSSIVTGSIRISRPQLETGSTATQYSPTTTAANSAPRLDYDPATLLPRGLLVEEQRTNNETNGVAFSSVTGIETTTQNAVGPDGVSNSAWTITGSGTNAVHAVWQNSVTPTANNTYTTSVFLKAGTQSLVQLAVSTAHSAATVYCNYNLSTTAPAMTAGAGIVSGSNFQTYIGNGWYRCGFSYVASAVTSSGPLVVTSLISSMADTRLPTNSLATTYYRFGGQYESTTGMGSAPFATSYIPTTTASATRSADSVSMTGTNLTSWFGGTSGTLVAEVSNVQGSSSAIWSFDQSTTNTLGIYYSGGGIYVNGEATGATTITNTVTALATHKIAYAFATNDRALVTNGGAANTQANGGLPAVDAFRIGVNRIAGGHTSKYIRRIQYYPTRLPNATLQSLTA